MKSNEHPMYQHYWEMEAIKRKDNVELIKLSLVQYRITHTCMHAHTHTYTHVITQTSRLHCVYVCM